MSNESSNDIQLSYADESTLRSLGTRLKNTLTRFKSEIVLSVLALILAGGQYLQSINSMSTDSAKLWKDGYTSVVRNRVTKFISLCKNWRDTNPEGTVNSLRIFTHSDEVLKGESIYKDHNLMELLAPDLEKISPDLKVTEEGGKLTYNDIVEAALNYRGSIIECLNTMEAVKTVIQTRPWWFNLISRDYLGERYNGLTKELTEGVKGSGGLRPFIDQYRLSHPRDTPVWAILTEHYIDRGWIVFIAVVALGAVCWLVYRKKKTAALLS